MGEYDYRRRDIRQNARVASHFLPDPGGEVVRDLLDVLDDLDQDHVLEIHDDGWSLQHGLACRDDLLGCEVNLAVSREAAAVDGPVAPLGRYLVLVENGRLLIGDEIDDV